MVPFMKICLPHPIEKTEFNLVVMTEKRADMQGAVVKGRKKREGSCVCKKESRSKTR